MSKKKQTAGERIEAPVLVGHFGESRWGVRHTGITWRGLKMTRWAYFDSHDEAALYFESNTTSPRSRKP